MKPHDEEVTVNMARNAWAKAPGFLKPFLPDIPVILRRVPKDALS